MYIVFLQKKGNEKTLRTFTEDECGFVPSVFGFKGIYITDKICKQNISTTGGLLKDVFFSMLRANQEKRNQNSFSKSLTYDPLITTCR